MTEPDEEPVTVLRWKSSLGCFLLLLAVMSLFFFLGAVNESMRADLAEGGRRGWIRGTADMIFGGVHVPLALLAFLLFFKFAVYGWRWADEVAATVTAEGIVPHRSVFSRTWRWDEIEDVSFEERRGSRVVIALRNGRLRHIGPVDNDGAAAERFADYARARALGHGAGTAA